MNTKHVWTILWQADGREVSLGLIYPCLLGAKMLGCTGFPWLIQGPLVLRTEEYLVYAFIITGLALSVVAYDYQVSSLLPVFGIDCLTFKYISRSYLTLSLSRTGDWSSCNTILHISCLYGSGFAISCQIKNNVNHYCFFTLFNCVQPHLLWNCIMDT